MDASINSSEWVNVGGYPTYLLRAGDVTSETKRLILIIPGLFDFHIYIST